MKAFASTAALLLLLVGTFHSGLAGDEPGKKDPPMIGRWDLTVKSTNEAYPSWLEVRRSGYQTLVGSFARQVGPASLELFAVVRLIALRKLILVLVGIPVRGATLPRSTFNVVCMPASAA